MSKPLRKLLGRYLIRDGRRIPLDLVPPDTILGLYFADDSAAGWEESLEKLMKFYEEMKRMDRQFDVILIPLREGSTSRSKSTQNSSNSNSGTRPGSSASNNSGSGNTDSSLPLDVPSSSSSSYCSSSFSFYTARFLSLEGKDARLKEEFLIRKYGVYQSSSLILIDSTSASVINFNGMPKILQDPKGIGFPFKNRPYSLILSSGPLISIKDSNSSSSSNSSSINRRARKQHQRSLTQKHQEQQKQQQQHHHEQYEPLSRTSPSSYTSSSSSSSPSPSPSSSSSPAKVCGSSFGNNSSKERPASSTSSPDYLNVYPKDGKKDNFKGFFFGAHWCPPCRSFCLNLIQVYKRLKQSKKGFEVIFVSSDLSRESFNKFFALMPWLAVPYEDCVRRQELTEIFNVKAIPSLIIVDDDGSEKIITSEGRLEINEDLEALDFPWYPRLVEELKDRHSTELNTLLCVIYFTSGDNDHEHERIEGFLHAAAAQIIESDVEEAFQPKFFIGTDSELSESLRLFIDLEENASYMVFLDIPHLKYCSFPASVFLDSHHVLEYVEKFRNSQLQCHRIRGHGRITI